MPIVAMSANSQGGAGVGVFGFALLLFVWMCGTLPLGILRHVTRGKKIITTEVR